MIIFCSFITMPQLLEKLTTQAKVEAREGLRAMVAALNGLAGIFIIQKEVRLIAMHVVSV